MPSAAQINGHSAPGYGAVRKAFEANFLRDDEHRELGAALCAYRHGECIVDLWGGYADFARSRPWTADSLVNVWSTTKGITALALALLIERAALDYQQRVGAIWPEFVQAGKREVTVAQVMCHRSGLPGFLEPTTTEQLYDWGGCCAKLAAQAPIFAPGSASCYHTLTYGYLAGEIVRRITGQSIGSFIDQALAGPLNADVYVGLPEKFDIRVAELIPPETPPAVGAVAELPKPVQMAMQNPALDPTVVSTRAWRSAEIPAVNGHASARGIARMFAMVANGGRLDGKRLLSPRSIAALSTLGGESADLLLGFDPQWAMGVSRNPSGNYGANPLAIGHSGWGGSFGCADAQSGISIGYVCNRMGSGVIADARTDAIVRSFPNESPIR
jgi:CubicO group peptidase (beta-lactamase class C family)